MRCYGVVCIVVRCWYFFGYSFVNYDIDCCVVGCFVWFLVDVGIVVVYDVDLYIVVGVVVVSCSWRYWVDIVVCCIVVCCFVYGIEVYWVNFIDGCFVEYVFFVMYDVCYGFFVYVVGVIVVCVVLIKEVF